MKLRAWFSLVPALLLILPVSHAQSTNASIYGTVVDTSGGAINKSAVVATNTKTGVALSTLSNESGVYIFPSLQPGEYSVSAEMPGFRKAVAQHVQLDVSARITVDLKLEVGAAAES